MPKLIEDIWHSTQLSPLQQAAIPFLAASSAFYRMGLSFDQFKKKANQKKLPYPILSIGNITVGGTGKTPVTLWLANQAAELGFYPCILSRGYGSRETRPRKVEPSSTDARLYGDEPLLMSRYLKQGCVYVGHDRWETGQFALSSGEKIDFFLLDDGFQHLRLYRDADIVLFDGARGIGNGHLLPWGPLREPMDSLSRAGHVGIICRSLGGIPQTHPADIPHVDFRLSIEPVGWSRLGQKEINAIQTAPLNQPFHLFSGIASPGGFAATVESLGWKISGQSIFADHHPFDSQDIHRLIDQAKSKKARLLTTAKDEMRLLENNTLWTGDEIPFIIQIGLKTGDGTDYLTKVLKQLLKGGEASDET